MKCVTKTKQSLILSIYNIKQNKVAVELEHFNEVLAFNFKGVDGVQFPAA